MQTLARNTWTFSLTFSVNSRRRQMTERPFKFKGSLTVTLTLPVLNFSTLSTMAPWQRGRAPWNNYCSASLFHNEPGSLFFWHFTSGLSKHVRDEVSVCKRTSRLKSSSLWDFRVQSQWSVISVRHHAAFVGDITLNISLPHLTLLRSVSENSLSVLTWAAFHIITKSDNCVWTLCAEKSIKSNETKWMNRDKLQFLPHQSSRWRPSVLQRNTVPFLTLRWWVVF